MAQKAANYKTAWHMLAFTRILLGIVFLWAFLDKTFGLGFSTNQANAWVNGGSPTIPFLQPEVVGSSPFSEFFMLLNNNMLVDVVFMIGLLGIGLALTLGIGLRVAAVTGSILLIMMWLALLPVENNPVIDDHLIYAAVLVVIAAGRREWSLTNWWLSFDVVKKNKWLW